MKSIERLQGINSTEQHGDLSTGRGLWYWQLD